MSSIPVSIKKLERSGSIILLINEFENEDIKLKDNDRLEVAMNNDAQIHEVDNVINLLTNYRNSITRETT